MLSTALLKFEAAATKLFSFSVNIFNFGNVSVSVREALEVLGLIFLGICAVFTNVVSRDFGWTPSQECSATTLATVFVGLGLLFGYVMAKGMLLILSRNKRKAMGRVYLASIAIMLLSFGTIEYCYGRYYDATGHLIIQHWMLTKEGHG